ncbi:MAG: YkgJ family cysteine cluster protein [Desulfobacteraceae bacterium]|nr:YkgJ family cysteine cluster protein [Desulfobacteraceae bacterium]
MTQPEKNKKQSRDETRSKQLLAAYMTQGREKLTKFFDAHGISLPVLGVAMEQFTKSVFALPGGAACKEGCAYCCHLKVAISIPEALVIYNELAAQTTPEGFEALKDRVLGVAAGGDSLDEAFWLKTQTPCPFLDIDHNRLCLIYNLRPFSCRAYHSTDIDSCRKGFEQGCSTLIPCFPLYRATTDMYASIFTRVLAEKGFFSYQVGFIKALEILFTNGTASDQWLNREDVFKPAKLI